MALTRDARLGRIWFVTLSEDVQEMIGDAVETVGTGVVGTERRPHSYSLKIPVHGAATDADMTAVGERLRRQFRSLLNNNAARLNGLFFLFDQDPSLNGLLVVGGGQLSYSAGGVTLSEYELQLNDAFHIAAVRTHMPARRLASTDRRLATTPRDTLKRIYSTDFANSSGLALHYFPPSATDLYSGATRTALLPTGTRKANSGDMPFVAGRTNGEVISFELTEESFGTGDVILYDTRTNPNPTEIAPRINLIPNPRLKWDQTGWTSNDASFRRIPLQYPNPLAVYQPFGWKVVASGSGQGPQATGLSVTNGQRYYFRARFYVESATTSVAVSVSDNVNTVKATFTTPSGATGEYLAEGEFVADATATNWKLRFLTSGAGNYVFYGTEFMLTPIPAAGVKRDYFDGDYDFCRFTGTAHQSTSEQYDNPQEDYGWEEVYGPDHPLTPGILPAMQNGVVRVRPAPHTGGLAGAMNSSVLAIDYFVAGTGWVEQGRVVVRREQPAFTYARFDLLRFASVEYWTSEKAIIKYTLYISTESGTRNHAEMYATLQRCWLGPRIECYMVYSGTDKPGVDMIYLPRSSVSDGVSAIATPITGVNNVAAIFNDPSETWNGSNSRTLTATDEPWAYLLPDLYQGVTVVYSRAGEQVIRWPDSAAYGTNRRGVAVHSPYNNQNVAGYASMQLGYGPRGAIIEAESGTLGSGTLNTDTLAYPATGNTSVQDTATAEPTNTVTIASATLDTVGSNAGRGVMGLWARVRVTTAGDTGSVKGVFGSNTIGTATFTASSGFTWVYVGALNRGSGENLVLKIWRSAGSGTTGVRIDRIILAPVTQQSAAVGAGNYDGARDVAQAFLYDSEAEHSVVER